MGERSEMKRIMLNTNVFCRPFDDMASQTIKEEAKYADFIFSLAHQNRIEIISSDVLYEETDLIENKAKYDSVYYLIKIVEKERITDNEEVIGWADSLNDIIKDYNDCLHIGFALAGKCSCLVTCDHELIKKREKIERFLLSKGTILAIKTPSEFASEY